MSRPVRERLYERTAADPATGCLLWTGPTTWDGYGRIRIGSRTDGTRRYVRVHRLAWELEIGPIAEGLTIDHVYDRGCRYPTCINVAHLEPVTVRENILRAVSGMGAVNRRKTHCVHGHELTPENTYASAGWRRCITCHRNRMVRARAARAA